jgi:chromosome segregation protein
MTSIPLPGMPTERLGVIGTRQLVVVQTLDIARLTAHPVRLIPETFIAVTGMGPVDSNESGKTSFLSAVSLLLGDPEWRVRGTGVASVEALLFEPITAGATLGVNAATEGYIVGVFAEPEDVGTTAHTVWMKISASRPHLQVRHAPGIHLARGTDDRGRHEAAPGIYRALTGDPLGSTEYAHVLYGRSPRVLAYVASRGRVRSRPSLLKLDAGTFTPEQIGDALITLTGRVTLFDRDHRDRRDLAAKQAELAQHIERDKQHTAREDAILRQVDARNRLRRQADAAAAQWRAYRARAVLDTYARAGSAAILLRRTETARDDLLAQLGQYERDQEALRNSAALRTSVDETAKDLNRHKTAYNDAVGHEAVLANTLNEQERRLRESRTAAAGHQTGRDGTAVACIAKRDALVEQLGAARRSQDEGNEEVRRLEEDIKRARDGQFGLAGMIIRTLGAAVPSISLAEATRLAPDTRHIWEARLAPWRDAVCVPAPYLPAALRALRATPGAIIISSNEPTTQPDVIQQLDTAVHLPEGVLSAPQAAVPLLRVLAAQSATEEPVPHVFDPNTGVHVVGGFDAPIIGGEDLRTHLDTRMRQARGELSTLNRRMETLSIELERAALTASRAEAAELITALEPEVTELARQLAEHRIEVLPPLEEQRDAAWRKHEDAKRALADRDKNFNKLAADIRGARERLAVKNADIERFTHATRPDDAVLAAWGRGREAAMTELGWVVEEPEVETPDRLREEATAPPITGNSSTIERRRAVALAEAARSQLGAALAAFDYYTEGAGGPPADLRLAARAYLETHEVGNEEPGGVLFETTLANLQAWLDDEADRDRTAPEQVQQARASRTETNRFVASQTRQLQDALNQTQQAITQRAASALDAISAALDQLNRESGGIGAQLDYDIIPPGAPDQDWTTRVTPRWRRNPGGPLLPYDNVTNTAQEKLFSIHLVIAALLAAPYPRGRVLILDELADSLGAEHRREVLDAIATVAKNHGITVLATCQDAIMVEARPYCAEVLYFHYPSRSEPLNRPTRMFGFDPNGERVELTAEALTEGRVLAQF